MTFIKFVANLGVLALLLVAGTDRACLAQESVVAHLKVGANARARSAIFDLPSTSQLTATLEEASSSIEGTVRIYVFDESGVLRGLDDPEIVAGSFSFQPANAGRYFVVVLNTNGFPVTIRLESFQVKGQSPAAREFAAIRVWFATNRQQQTGEPARFGDDPAAELTYGFSDVSIPRDHRMGELEGPSIWRLQFREDPDKHVTVLSTQRESGSEFYRSVGARVAQSDAKQVLVFVHGFNQTFEDATKRTAQVAYDLAFDGPSIAFCWPSQGVLLDYVKDQRNADVSGQALETFLLRLKGSSKQITVHLIAHSMGNRVLARALEHMTEAAQGTHSRMLNEVAMMAPDVDAALFRQVTGKISASARRVTLYASTNDNALKLSMRLAGYPRAGDAGANLVVAAGIDTVDASNVQTGILGLGHSYYADNSTILSELFALVRGRPPNERFGLQEISGPAGHYWQFRPALR